MAALIKTKAWLLIGLLLIACQGRYLLKPTDVPDWQVSKIEVYGSTAQLKQILGESFQLYSGYQIKQLRRQQLTSSDYRQILVEIFEMEDEVNARGIYRRYQSFNSTNIGAEASIGPGQVVFYRRQYFVRLTGQRNMLGKEEQLVAIARLIDAKLSKQ